MSCAAGDACLVSSSTAPGNEAAPNHACRAHCGGVLHGVCGAQDPESDDNEMHRVCPPCLAASSSKGKGKESAKGKRKLIEQLGPPGPSPTGTTKKKPCQSATRKRLTIHTKAQIVEEVENRVSHAALAEKYGCGVRVIARCVSEKKKIRAASNRPGEAGEMKSLRVPQHSEVSERVLLLLQAARKAGILVTQDVIQMFGLRAKDMLAASTGLSERQKNSLEAFTASQGWVQAFVKRNGLQSEALLGKTGNVKAKDVEASIQTVRDACESYDIENIFNVGETGLFYNLLPKRTYLATSSENRPTARGTKDMRAKNRLSAYMCTNATGSAKVPLAIIGKSKNPRCFRHKQPPVKYFQQANAWPDGVTLQKWWQDVFLPYARRHTNEPVLLIMDGGGSSHSDLVDGRGQVTVVTYPANYTSKHQPMDMGVIAETKIRYRAQLLGVRVGTMRNTEQLRQQAKQRKMQAGTAGLAEGHPAHVLDAAEILNEAWQRGTKVSIARCWLEADTLPPAMHVSLERTAGRDVPKDNEDPAMQQLKDYLTNLSVSVRRSGVGAVGGPDDAELCEVLAELDITPGDAPNATAMAAVKSWALIEDHEDVVTALRLDAQDEIVDRVGLLEFDAEGAKEGTPGVSSDESEVEEGTKSGGGVPPPLSNLLVHFDQLEEYAEASSNDDACHALRRAKLAFVRAYAERSAK